MVIAARRWGCLAAGITEDVDLIGCAGRASGRGSEVIVGYARNVERIDEFGRIHVLDIARAFEVVSVSVDGVHLVRDFLVIAEVLDPDISRDRVILDERHLRGDVREVNPGVALFRSVPGDTLRIARIVELEAILDLIVSKDVGVERRGAAGRRGGDGRYHSG